MRQSWKMAFAICGMSAGVLACGGTTRVAVSDAGASGSSSGGSSSGGTSSGGGSAAGGTTATGGTTAEDACTTVTDCAWGEIDHEILSAKDCPCVYGCPGIAQSSATVQRRLSQYSKLCVPNHDGMGNPCGIDDCVAPPSLKCAAGKCVGPLPL